MAEKYSLKDELYNAEKVAYLGQLFAQSDPAFDANGFQTAVMSKLLELELKARIFWIAEVLEDFLPSDFPAACDTILAALPDALDPTKNDDDFGDFIFCPLGEYVAKHGIKDHLLQSLDMLEALTQRFTMEWPIRPFLIHHPDSVMKRMAEWVDHDSYHVRRLVSEGTRPKLPWGVGTGMEVSRPLELLDRLHADPTRYVTRSVANHLNDVTKSNPDLVIDRLDAWRQEGRQSTKELAWLSSHALRGLIKAGHPRAMAFQGFSPEADVSVTRMTLDRTVVEMGSAVDISFTLEAANDTPVLVDYVIDFVKANGQRKPKVFKLKQAVLKAGQPMTFTKRHMFKAGATTFALYEGAHRVSAQMNGRILDVVEFTLTSP